jgi:hypothetical protein
VVAVAAVSTSAWGKPGCQSGSSQRPGGPASGSAQSELVGA